jgi:hypothetical protein
MDFTGRVILDLPLEEGVSKAGNPWRKKCWVLETFGQYPKRVKIDTFNAGVDNVKLEVGKIYVCSVDAESREFNGKWYTDLRCYAARESEDPSMGGGMPGGQQNPFQSPAAPAAAPAAAPFPAADPFGAAPGAAGAAAFKDESDDLPF